MAPTDVVLAYRPAGVHFLSGHLGEPAFLLEQVPAGGAARALRERNIQHVLLTAFSPEETGKLAPKLMKSCTELRVEARFAPHGILFSISAPDVASADACTAIAEYLRENREPAHAAAP
jgi:hypothetical protein